FLGIADSVGTVEEGKIADLVLLRANPLEDIANVREISAVMVRGVVLDQGDLEQVHQDVHDASDRYINDWPRENWSPPEESADRE
ncbi:MAG: amidohydrolase family protein, partial [Gemmatimonadota bacterium]